MQYDLLAPTQPWLLYVFAHGAGAGMHHRFMVDVANRLHARGIATLRYQFPYMENGGKRPDVPNVLEATVRRAIELGAAELPNVPMIAGGKSMGGRMTSQLLAKQHDLPVRGLAFTGYPLHAPNKPGRARAQHLFDVVHPMLFLQGTRDSLADIGLMRDVTSELGDRATMHIIEGADHSFGVLKKSGRTDAEVLDELADTIAFWARSLV
jgi:uncharacterized protein